MKKYVKPDLLFEDYELSVGVAACTEMVFGANGVVKSWDESDPGLEIFKEEGYFGGSCETQMTKDIYLGYYGEIDSTGEIFGS